MTTAADGGGDQKPDSTQRSESQLLIYLVVMVLLCVPVLGLTAMWAFSATMFGAGCHGNDDVDMVFGIDVCTVEGQHLATLQPLIAVISAAVFALAPVVVVARNQSVRWAWVWVGAPLAAAAYAAGPYIAALGRSASIW